MSQKLGENRGRVPHMLYVGPAYPRVLLMGKEKSNYRNETGS
jgi:hypothetical protein